MWSDRASPVSNGTAANDGNPQLLRKSISGNGRSVGTGVCVIDQANVVLQQNPPPPLESIRRKDAIVMTSKHVGGVIVARGCDVHGPLIRIKTWRREFATDECGSKRGHFGLAQHAGLQVDEPRPNAGCKRPRSLPGTSS